MGEASQVQPGPVLPGGQPYRPGRVGWDARAGRRPSSNRIALSMAAATLARLRTIPGSASNCAFLRAP